MLEVIVTVVFAAIAFRVARAIAREVMVFRELKQSRLLALLVLLYPLGPIVMLLGARDLPLLFASLISSGCYLPGLLAARRPIKAFEQAGTDRAKAALTASSEAYAAGIGGLLYIAAVLIISLAVPGV